MKREYALKICILWQNIFLPSNELTNIERVSHLVLTRTGLYIIDSQLLKGHVYNGISGAQFKELPTMSQVFDTLDLDSSQPQRHWS